MKKFFAALLILIVAGGYGYWSISRPIPSLQPVQLKSSLQTTTSPSTLGWPTSQSAVALLGTGITESHGPQTPVPTASTAKIITALLTLKQKPLQLGEQGPAITITAEDVERYKNYVAQDGSVVPVQAGEQITEYQALQALLLPSANNIADKLAMWSYGSLDQYKKSANSYLFSVGLKDTVVGSDASGLSPDTTSTAADMVKIGSLAMQNPVIAQIVGQASATGIPLTTSIKNVNFLLGTDGVIGIKTGNSDQAGGVFIGAAKFKVGNEDKTVITAVMGAPDIFTALKQSQTLIRSSQTNFSSVEVAKKDAKLGEYKQPWGGSIKAVTAQNLPLTAWNGSTIKPTISLKETGKDPQANQVVGKLTANGKTTDIVLGSAPTKPSIFWRLSHPLN
jgi:D-alanyl-D-alanine carboxypeptidase (penicillin-binding protein 5/6)